MPEPIAGLITAAKVHPEWQPILETALGKMDTNYLASLLADNSWLPGQQNLLAAFRRDLQGTRYILFGESPYPRSESANGIAFYDAAVGSLWSDSGLSKAVNRATSLRNLIKTLLLSEGLLKPDSAGKISQESIAEIDKSNLINNIYQLFQQFEIKGFLMLNASPVLHLNRKPQVEARYWQPFIQCLLHELPKYTKPAPTLVLWGKVATTIEHIPASTAFPQLTAEHPYNISFIHNPEMQHLFQSLQLLKSYRLTRGNAAHAESIAYDC